MGYYYNRLFSIVSVFCVIILFCSCDVSKDIPRSKDIFTLSLSTEDSIGVKGIVSKQNTFKKSKTYKKTNDSILWCKLEVLEQDLQQKTNRFLVGSDPFMESGKAYVVKQNDSIIELHRFIHNKENAFDFVFYRSPVWELPVNIKPGDQIFLQLEGHTLRNRLDFFIYDTNALFKIMQLEYFFFGSISAFLFSLCVLLLVYSFLIRKLSIICYVLYVFFIVFDFFSSRGIGKQFLWYSNDFLMQNRSFSFLLALTFISFFFVHFYTYNRKNKIFKTIFNFFSIISCVLVIMSIVNYFHKISENFIGITFNSIQLIAFLYLVIHIILAFRKQIPIYLAVGFSIPFVALIFYIFIISYIETGSSIYSRFLLLNLPYIGFTVEIIIMTYFIIDKMIKVQGRYFKLKRVNSSLKYSINNSVIDAELKERKKLLNGIHDTFGGYVEAMKYNLRDDNSKENIEKTITTFYNQYRLILKNLDTQKVSANNLETTMNDYLDELRGVFAVNFKISSSIAGFYFSKEKSTHIYMSFCELITNALKHSKASEIVSNIYVENNLLILEVSDDGIGFKKVYKSGYGIKQIEDRNSRFGGSLNIETNEPGSIIIIKLPL